MSYALRPGVSYCEVSGRFLFLDVLRDRYVCLSGEAEAALARLGGGAELTEADRTALDQLCGSGLLQKGEGGNRIAPCAAPVDATDTLLDASGGSSIVELGRAVLALADAQWRLRRRGLAAVIADLRAAKARLAVRDQEQGALDVARAFHAAGQFVSSHDQCLPRSLAVAQRLISKGLAPDLVLGVCLQPFRAHCWVQLNEQLVNERREVTRMFQPILVV